VSLCIRASAADAVVSKSGTCGSERMDVESDLEAECPRKRVNASIPPGNDRTSRRMFPRFERKTQGHSGNRCEKKKQGKVVRAIRKDTRTPSNQT
jgi:hypothetical protein